MNEPLKHKLFSVYGQLLNTKILTEAWKKVRANRGSGGIDGESIKDFEKEEDKNIEELLQSLKDRRAVAVMLIAVFSGPFVGVSLSLKAVQYTAAGIASTIMAMSPVLILLPSRWLFHQPVTLRAVLGALISCVGVSLFFLL